MGSRVEALVRSLTRTEAEALHLVPGQRIFLTRGSTRAVVGREPLSDESFGLVSSELVPGADPAALAEGRHSVPLRIDPQAEPLDVRWVFSEGRPAIVMRRASAPIPPSGVGRPMSAPATGAPDISFADVELDMSTRLASAAASVAGAATRPAPAAPLPAEAPPRLAAAAGSARPPLEALLLEMVASTASDGCLLPGAPPAIRVGGAWRPLRELPVLDGKRIRAVLEPAFGDHELVAGSVTVHQVAGAGSFRLRLFRDTAGIGAAIRPLAGPGAAAAVPEEALRLADAANGVVLVSSSSGPARATGLAALAARATARRVRFVCLVTDRLDVPLPPGLPLLSRRDPAVAGGFAAALEAAARDGADLLVVEELSSGRDGESAAVAAEDGVLVLAGASSGAVMRLKGAMGRSLRGILEASDGGWRLIGS